jgi:hypothetical protein
MKKIMFLLPMACCWLVATAQPNQVAKAEQAFAQMAIDSGTQKAFLYFLADSSILFYKGKRHDALPFWKNQPGGGGLLLWKPVYTGIAASGDLGFSTGPFEVRAEPGAAVRESGNYSSIWVKNKQGQWKMLIDLGVSYTPSLFQKQVEQVVYHKLSPVSAKPDWQKTELDLIDQYRQKGARSFLSCITNDSWFNVQDQQPMHTVKDIEAGLSQIPGDLQFNIMGGGIAAAGDLFYAYGSVTRNGNKENYLRVWGYQKEGWKLLLQVLQWPR